MSKTKPRKKPETPVEGAATGIIRYQLGNAKDRILELEAEVTALTKELGRAPNDLLVEMAQALNLAREVTDARKGQSYDESGIPQRSGEHLIPGQPTAHARWHARRFKNRVKGALGDFTYAVSKGWPKPPLLARCRNRDCVVLDQWVPAWDNKGPNEYCTKCGNRFPQQRVTADFA